jgi:hypothetical protein
VNQGAGRRRPRGSLRDLRRGVHDRPADPVRRVDDDLAVEPAGVLGEKRVDGAADAQRRSSRAYSVRQAARLTANLAAVGEAG